MLRATTACTFSTSQLPKVVRDRQFLTLLTWKCASHHNGVQFFIAPVASWLRTRRFSEPTFRPSGATNHWKKHSVSRLSYLFAHLYLLSSYSFSSDLLSSNLPLCFSSVHIVGSLTSKLPSTSTCTTSISLIQTKQKRAAREQRNKHKPRTETRTKQEQHLPIRHASRPADCVVLCDIPVPHSY